MKTILILGGANALVLISMESPAFGSPAPRNEAEAIASLVSDIITDMVSCSSASDCYGKPYMNCCEGRRCHWTCYRRRCFCPFDDI